MEEKFNLELTKDELIVILDAFSLAESGVLYNSKAFGDDFSQYNKLKDSVATKVLKLLSY